MKKRFVNVKKVKSIKDANLSPEEMAKLLGGIGETKIKPLYGVAQPLYGIAL